MVARVGKIGGINLPIYFAIPNLPASKFSQIIVDPTYLALYLLHKCDIK